ncbi:MAG: hypothetical protein CVU06_06935 [Bacteroidetes bacterium HGW-Bacteroidetes-22]|nr:MAG: hypothetical protein CVU06_06935 [Bacteroidetes bacterium HGW-Bacteroidetes-22]
MQMKNHTKSAFLFFLLMILATGASFAQFNNNQDAIDYINDRLSHSIVQKIDADGLVTMKAPSERITFLLADVMFTYNDLNGDSRVRVVCNNCLKYYEQRELQKHESRQSFLCDTDEDAFEVIKAFGYLKSKFPASVKANGISQKKLAISDTTLGYSTVAEAIDLVNSVLVHSMITGIDQKGIMAINSPSNNYLVDLRNAEFAFNDLSDDPKVRIYGDFCLRETDEDGANDYMSRQSFTARSRFKAYKAIKALYYIKTAYSDLPESKVPMLRNVKRNRLTSYSNIVDAISYINDRLTYSVIMGVDNNSVMSINAPNDIYRVNLKNAKFSYSQNSKVNVDWLGITFDGNRIDGVEIICNNCLEKFNSPDDKEVIDNQTFQCESETQVREVLKAITYIKEMSK